MAHYIYNNNFFSGDKVTIPINSKAIRYGNGLFETMFFDQSKIRNYEFHFERLSTGVKQLGANLPYSFDSQKLLKSINLLCEKNNLKRARIRLTFFIGEDGLFENTTTPNVEFILQCFPISETIDIWNSNGLHLGVYKEVLKCADALSHIKHNNFLPYQMAATWAKQNRFNDAILINQHERLADTCIANVFLIMPDETIVTPPLSEGPIAGTQRRYLLEQLPKLGFSVFEQQIELNQLEKASECFITNAMSPIRWVKEIGNNASYSNTITSSIFSRLF